MLLEIDNVVLVISNLIDIVYDVIFLPLSSIDTNIILFDNTFIMYKNGGSTYYPITYIQKKPTQYRH